MRRPAGCRCAFGPQPPDAVGVGVDGDERRLVDTGLGGGGVLPPVADEAGAHHQVDGARACAAGDHGRARVPVTCRDAGAVGMGPSAVTVRAAVSIVGRPRRAHAVSFERSAAPLKATAGSAGEAATFGTALFDVQGQPP